MKSTRGIVVAGAGLAGVRTIEALRREGYDGPLTLVGDEAALPYDRPPLSKDVLIGTRGPDSTTLLDAEELARLDVSLELGRPVTGLDVAARAVELGDRRLSFARLVIATGASPRRLPVFDGLGNVHVLRTRGDARRLRDALVSSERVLVVGAGVIGCEVAASARTLGRAVTLIEAAPAAMLRSVGAEMGAVCGELHRRHGTDLRCAVTVERVEGDSRAERVVLSDGTVLEPDVVVVGVGVVPCTAWLERSGLTLANGVVCDASLRAGPEGVYAAGDVACFPRAPTGELTRGEHWTNATEQARYVARQLLGKPGSVKPFVGSDYVWSDQYGTRIQFTGSPDADDVILVSGSAGGDRLLAWYRRHGRLVGALAIGEPRLFAKSRQLITRRVALDEALLEMGA